MTHIANERLAAPTPVSIAYKFAMQELRNDTAAWQTELIKPSTFVITNPYPINREPVFTPLIKAGPQGRPARNKAKSRAAKQARKRNR